MTRELLLRSILSLQGSASSWRDLCQTGFVFLKTNKALNVVMTVCCAWLGRISDSEAGSAENSRWKCAELLALQVTASR